MRKRIFILSFLAFLGLTSILVPKVFTKKYIPVLSDYSSQNTLLKHSTLTINNKTISVEIADTENARSLGLSGRKSLGSDQGMLFIWDKEVYPIFWMKDMNFSLDLIWINAVKIVAINENVPNEPTKKDNELTLYRAPTAINMVFGSCRRLCPEKWYTSR